MPVVVRRWQIRTSSGQISVRSSPNDHRFPPPRPSRPPLPVAAISINGESGSRVDSRKTLQENTGTKSGAGSRVDSRKTLQENTGTKSGLTCRLQENTPGKHWHQIGAPNRAPNRGELVVAQARPCPEPDDELATTPPEDDVTRTELSLLKLRSAPLPPRLTENPTSSSWHGSC